MLKNYFISAIRNLLKYKLYTLINILSLAVSLALVLIVIGHTTYELSFEDCHINKDRVYRINAFYSYEDSEMYTAQINASLGEAIAAELPEVEGAAIFRIIGGVKLIAGENQFINRSDWSSQGYEPDGNVFCANPEFLNVFTIPFAEGDPQTALNDPNSVVISEDAAELFFSGRSALGQQIQIKDGLECRVTGIMKNIPENTQLHCDFIISYSSLETSDPESTDMGELNQDYVYLLLARNADPNMITARLSTLFSAHVGEAESAKYNFELQKLKDIYFSVYSSGRSGDIFPAGETSLIYTIAFTAGFILLLAIANFINLSTARSAQRMKEVGVRKVFGAHRSHLIKQFLGESILISVTALFLSLLLYEIFKVIIQDYLPRQMFTDFYSNTLMVICLFGLIVVVGIMAGFYPALYLSRFKPIVILQNKFGFTSSKSLLRKILVIFQFTIAVGFICCTLITFKQTNLLTSQPLGFNKDNIVVLDFNGEKANEDCLMFRNELKNSSGIIDVTALNGLPGVRSTTSYAFYPDTSRQNYLVAKAFLADNNFTDMFDLQLVQGHGLDDDRCRNYDNAILINESAINELETSSLLGTKFYASGGKVYEVVGVVKDFQASTLDFLYQPVTVIMHRPEKAVSLAVRVDPNQVSTAVAGIGEKWRHVFPERSFSYSFLDDLIAGNYSESRGQIKLFLVLSIITISIACLGIFALVSFTAERKTKEIGIRKVLGASMGNIIKLLGKEFLILISISNAIAWPLAYLVMGSYLREYPLRINIGVDIFLLTGFIALALAFFTISFQAIKAASMNPINSLRNE